MTGGDVLDVVRDALWVSIQVGAPLLLVALVVGVVISLVQALTQIQEMTLTFVPKILSLFLALLLFSSFIGRTLGDFATRLFDRIVGLS